MPAQTLDAAGETLCLAGGHATAHHRDNTQPAKARRMQAVEVCIADVGRCNGDTASTGPQPLHRINRGIQHQAVCAAMHHHHTVEAHDLHHLEIVLDRGFRWRVGAVAVEREAIVGTKDMDVRIAGAGWQPVACRTWRQRAGAGTRQGTLLGGSAEELLVDGGEAGHRGLQFLG